MKWHSFNMVNTLFWHTVLCSEWREFWVPACRGTKSFCILMFALKTNPLPARRVQRRAQKLEVLCQVFWGENKSFQLSWFHWAVFRVHALCIQILQNLSRRFYVVLIKPEMMLHKCFMPLYCSFICACMQFSRPFCLQEVLVLVQMCHL